MDKAATIAGQTQTGVPSLWQATHLSVATGQSAAYAPPIAAGDVRPILASHLLWDLWPVQNDDGSVADIAGGSLWMILSAPRGDDPDLRHDVARIRLFHRVGAAWRDCGLLLPEGLNPGSREWSGSARFDATSGRVHVYFTAAGQRGEAAPSFEQRLFQTDARLVLTGKVPVLTDWTPPVASVVNDGRQYVDLAHDWGRPGHIRGFRDPYWLRDPADGRAYLLFTGSLAHSRSAYNGVVGLAAAHDEDGHIGFELEPPIISADGLANEMERPHLLIRDGLYYLFWSTQASVFDPAGPVGPSGLYGMVARALRGPWQPLNGSGLVIANPPAEPKQAYCWQVLDTLDVVSFVDLWGLAGRDPAADVAVRQAQFGGTAAPTLRIALDGDRAALIGRTDAA